MINQIPAESKFCNDYNVDNQCPCFDNFGRCRMLDVELEPAKSVDHNWALYTRAPECLILKPKIKIADAV